MKRLGKAWLFPAAITRTAEGIAALMLAVMFGAFILQIFSRYVLAEPFGWTLELCLTMWLWIVFWGNALVVKHKDHVTFDVLYQSVGLKTRRIFMLITSAAIVVGMAVSLFPTWDFIDFLKIKKSATLRIPMRNVFSIYMLFLVAMIISYSYHFLRAIKNKFPEENEFAKDNLGKDWTGVEKEGGE